MTFVLDEPKVTEQALRAAEATAPKNLKALLHASANELKDYRDLCDDIAAALEEAATLRVGAMDTQSRTDETMRTIRRVLVDSAIRMREQLAKSSPASEVI